MNLTTAISFHHSEEYSEVTVSWMREPAAAWILLWPQSGLQWLQGCLSKQPYLAGGPSLVEWQEGPDWKRTIESLSLTVGVVKTRDLFMISTSIRNPVSDWSGLGLSVWTTAASGMGMPPCRSSHPLIGSHFWAWTAQRASGFFCLHHSGYSWLILAKVNKVTWKLWKSLSCSRWLTIK